MVATFWSEVISYPFSDALGVYHRIRWGVVSGFGIVGGAASIGAFGWGLTKMVLIMLSLIRRNKNADRNPF